MYNTYFGFREKPFKLVPNPEYLFLSKTHEIALAHLTYATEQGDGFVVIIGEVGTGKTTLCRNYLEGLDENTASAYIFNPRLDSNELLAGICNEFGIQTAQESTKSLLDILNRFLIKQNAAGRKVVLLIDEAQLLSIDNLELVRMLSNLETTKNKLLQIILVGQPELAEKLETYELRQLAQRISLNYHLTPLSLQDTEAYIQHRIGIASQRQAKLFTSDACRLAYRYAKGIPRLINIVSDRALLTAFSQNKSKVTKVIMQAAIAELTSATQVTVKRRQQPLVWAAIIAVLACVIVAGLVMLLRNPSWTFFSRSDAVQSTGEKPPSMVEGQPKSFKVPTVKTVEPSRVPDTSHSIDPLPEQPADSVQEARELNATREQQATAQKESDAPDGPAPASQTDDHEAVEALVAALDPIRSRQNSAAVLLSIWNQPRPNVELVPAEVDDPSFFNIVARQYGLRSHAVTGNWDLVKRVDLPAILTLRSAVKDRNVYVSLVGWHESGLELQEGGAQGHSFNVSLDTIKSYLDGPVYIFWKNVTGFDMIISQGADHRAVLVVKNLLRKIGYHHLPIDPVFDYETRRAIRDFQAGHQLGVDGLVGPVTKMMLLREAGMAQMPYLSSVSRTGS